MAGSNVERKIYTPPEVARRHRVSPVKVIGWLRSGELKGIDVSSAPGGRPRFRITADDLAEFERRRAVASQASDSEALP
jgi:transposase